MFLQMNSKLKKIYFSISIFAILISMVLLVVKTKDAPSIKFDNVQVSTKKTLPIGTSFSKDQTKIYVFKTTKTKRSGEKIQVWEFKNGSWVSEKNRLFFTENEKGFRDDQAEALLISYPIILGKKWYVEDDEMMLIRIYEEVTTKAGTFHNVIEVTQSNEEQTKIAYRHFYAENIGLIRTETGDGKLLNELIELIDKQ